MAALSEAWFAPGEVTNSRWELAESSRWNEWKIKAKKWRRGGLASVREDASLLRAFLFLSFIFIVLSTMTVVPSSPKDKDWNTGPGWLPWNKFSSSLLGYSSDGGGSSNDCDQKRRVLNPIPWYTVQIVIVWSFAGLFTFQDKTQGHQDSQHQVVANGSGFQESGRDECLNFRKKATTQTIVRSCVRLLSIDLNSPRRGFYE